MTVVINGETGINMPMMAARTRTSGFLPHHLPKLVKVWLAPAFRSL